MKFRDLIAQENVNALPPEILELTEAKFNEKNIEKVVKLYSKIMGKRLGGAFKPLGFEQYKRKWGPGKGFRVMNEKGAQLRFNWDAKLAKQAIYELTSMDYWAPKNKNFQWPTRTVMFAPELNVVQILDKVSTALLTGKLKEANEVFNEFNAIHEARSKEERIAFAKEAGLPASAARSEDYLRGYGKSANISEQVEIFLGSSEVNSFEGELKEVEKKFDKQVFADPDTVFEDIEDLVGIVASGKWRTLIVCGQGGVGKTFHITEGPRSLKALLGSEGKKWTYHSGTKASPLSFYKTLFEERDKIIVFDEADALLKHSEIVMMLKPILDTSGANMAEYGIGTYNMVGKSVQEIEKFSSEVQQAIQNGAISVRGKTKRLFDPLVGDKLQPNMSDQDVMLPSKFPFTGGMIFISNMKSEQIEGAIMSRSIFVDVYLAEQDILKRVKSIGYHLAKNSLSITEDKVDNVLEALGDSGSGKEHKINYMTPEHARKGKEITVRALQLGLILQESGLTRWKDLVALYA
jgi:hypothetical protein